MGIWDDVSDDENFSDAEEKNPYLSDPKKSIELIAKLLPNHQKRTNFDEVAGRLDYMLDNEILMTLKDVGGNTIELSRRLTKLSDKIMEYKKIRLLSGKSIIGIVGRFSSGKSSFINSLLQTSDNRIILPENQNPTTSIPTYIVDGEKEIIQAYSGGRTINLDIDAMQAMTHEFYEKYQIGFSRFVGNLVIHTPDFPQNQKGKIAILDTPGYNKADTDTRENLSDEYIAEQQLKAANFLILLITDVITAKDIDFIRRVKTETPILVVVNKADEKIESDLRAILENVRQVLKANAINTFGVTAYSSRNGVEYFGNKFVPEFLNFTAKQAEKSNDVETEINNLTASIDSDFNREIEAAKKRRNELGDSIYNAKDILAIKSLTHIYSRVCQKYGRLQGNRKNFIRIAKKIHDDFKNLMSKREEVKFYD